MERDDVVLVIDDDPAVTRTLRDFIAAEGHAVAVAHTGAAGLQRIREGDVGLVLLDLLLPDTKGTDVMREALRDPAPPEFIIVTGHATLDSAIEAVEGSAAGYLPKPVDFSRLGTIVRRVLERRRLTRDNARLQREVADRLAESEALAAIATTASSTLNLQEALRRMSRGLARLLGADTAAAYLLDPTTEHIVPTAAYHVPKEHLATLATTGLPLREQGFYLPLWRDQQPVYSDDVGNDERFSHALFRAFPHRSGLLLPLALDDEVVGAFYLVWWTARRTLAERELQVLARVTAQVGLFLRNARLYEQAERNQHRLEALNEVSRRLAAVHEQEEVLSLIVNEAARLLRAEAAGLRLVEGEDLVVSARTESAAALMVRSRLKPGESLSGRVVATGAPLVVEDLAQDTLHDPVHKRGAIEHGYRGFVGVPLRSHGRVLGTLNIFTKGARHFPPDEIALLTALADQASVTIEKARLYEASRARARELGERNTQLRHLHEAARVIPAERDVGRLLQTIVESSRELLGAGYGALAVFGDDDRVSQFLTAGLTPEARERIAALPEGRGLLGYVFKHGKTLRLGDLTAHPAAVGFPPGHPPMRSLLAVPIHFRQQILGALYLTEKPGGFTVEDEALLATLSADAAVALENARLFDETRTQQTRLSQIFESTSDGIILVSRAGEIQAVNRQSGDLLGFDAEDTVGVGLAELLAGYRSSMPDHERVFAALHALLESPDGGGQGDLDLRRMGRIIHWVGQPTKDAAGRTVGLTLTLRNVTQERQVAQMKTDFVSFVTHQLRTPLAGIKWMLELAQEAPGVPDEPLGYVQDARQAADRLIGLVNDLLDISRLESGKLTVTPEPVNLGALTQQVLDGLVTLVRERGHRLSVEGADAVPAVRADAQLLRQVVLNLASNAIKYTPTGGAVVIRMERVNGSVRWAITDSGIGIPAASQARLFEKFYRADNAFTIETEGTGLGLYLVRLILEKLDGQVWCESEEGKGSTFIFTLPVSG